MASKIAHGDRPNGPGSDDALSGGFASKLEQGRQRFLAHAIEHSLEVGRRTAADFIRHFPPAAIMEGLADRPNIRAEILVNTTGIKKKIAEKKSWNSAAEDLQIALEEGETNPATIVSVFDPDDRVRYLNDQRLWAFVTEGSFWTATPGKKEEYRVAKRHLAFLLERALTDRLISHRDIVEGISVAEIAMRLPKAELGKIIERALSQGHDGAPFTEVELWAAMPAEVLVEYVPLPHVYESVVRPKIAEAHGYVDKPPEQEKAERGGSPLDDDLGDLASLVGEPMDQDARVNTQEWAEMAEASESVVDDEISDDDFAPA
jgi:hypothetical protein